MDGPRDYRTKYNKQTDRERQTYDITQMWNQQKNDTNGTVSYQSHLLIMEFVN